MPLPAPEAPMIETIALTALSWLARPALATAQELLQGWLRARVDDAGNVVRVELGLAPLQGPEATRLAWVVYVELVTRVSIVPMDHDDGLDREALTSLHRLFGTIRDALVQAGPAAAARPAAGGASVAAVCAVILNLSLRPFLSHWHPRLQDHEARRPEGTPAWAHEQAWEHHPRFRKELRALQGDLSDLARALEAQLGVDGPASLLPRRQG